ncbi:MAG: hypothetical protein JSU73_13045 [candidate division WOR-3 bacterium]|nr:MAG: hypothetical protein JSU73_13045 [candidate division WOR-3 bacterium]
MLTTALLVVIVVAMLVLVVHVHTTVKRLSEIRDLLKRQAEKQSGQEKPDV